MDYSSNGFNATRNATFDSPSLGGMMDDFDEFVDAPEFIDAPEQQVSDDVEGDVDMSNNDYSPEASVQGVQKEENATSELPSFADFKQDDDMKDDDTAGLPSFADFKQDDDMEGEEELDQMIAEAQKQLETDDTEQEDEARHFSGVSRKPFTRQPVEETIEPTESINIQKDSGSQTYLNAYLKAISKSHKGDCNGIPGHPTPSHSPPPGNTLTAAQSFLQETRRTDPPKLSNPAPNPDKDLSKNLFRHKKFHDRVTNMVPRLPLAPHRYWVGVTAPDRDLRNVTKEEHITWMKGSRFTTIETVYRAFEHRTATTDFALMLGMERLSFKDMMGELDYFNDKHIVLRAMEKRLPEAKGRKLTDGLMPPETKELGVIDLD